MSTLPDVNVLVALAWPNHVHHGAAREWFDGARGSGWATCGVTQTGFIRVSSNRRVIPEARTPGQSAALLRQVCGVGQHTFWDDDVSWVDRSGPDASRLQGYRQVTDAHLVALARARGGRLVSFDRGVASMHPDAVDLLSLV